MIGRGLSRLEQVPQTLVQLQHEILTAWEVIPQEEIDHLVRSMLWRVRECINARGVRRIIRRIIDFLSIILVQMA
jgi:hypothetical protein